MAMVPGMSVLDGTADGNDGAPERFVPEEMAGGLEEAEHLTRYVFAARHAAGRRVLDAGCGMAYGCDVLARAGAVAVTGVDVAQAPLDAAAPHREPVVKLQRGDLRALTGIQDASFDLVVCFEVLEHVAEQEAVLDELTRVLAPGGLLVVSSPNRDTYPEGNPHHVRELIPSELNELLAARFAHVSLQRQHEWIASVVLGDHAFAASDPEEPLQVRLGKTVGRPPGSEMYVIGVASDDPLPDLEQVGTLTHAAEMRRWLALYAEQQQVLERQAERIEADQVRFGETRELRGRLRDAERELGEQREARWEGEQRLDELSARLQADAAHIAELEHERALLQQRIDGADRVLQDVFGSPSWRVTAPLRRAKGVLR